MEHCNWSGRRVRRIDDGRVYIETTAREWQVRFRAWQTNPELPMPMPGGHLMFNPRNHAGYGVEQVGEVTPC